MVTKTTKTAETKKEETKKVETLNYRLEVNGIVMVGSTSLRQFQPNAKGFQNSGFQVKVSNGQYSGNIMIIDAEKQIRL